MRKALMVLAVSVMFLMCIALAGTAVAQSASDLQEKAKAAEESMKEKMGKSGDQKAAAPGKPEHKEGPCKQVLDTCKNAGFVAGQAAKGYGLYGDCVNPIMQHKTVVPNAIKPLPSVDPKVVAECKKRDPAFGAGPVGSPKHK